MAFFSINVSQTLGKDKHFCTFAPLVRNNGGFEETRGRGRRVFRGPFDRKNVVGRQGIDN